MLSISFVAIIDIFFSVLFIQLFQFFPEVLCHVFIKYHSILSSSCSILSLFQPECCLNPFSLIRFLSRSNRSGFIVYLILWAFNSRHSRRSSLLLECSRFFASSLKFLFHLILFPFRLGPKISGRDLLLVEECCNAPDSMRQVSASYSPLLPCHLLACCILPCHHLHFICMFFKTCIRSGSAGSLCCPFRVQTHSHAPAAPPKYYFISGIKMFSEWVATYRVVLL